MNSQFPLSSYIEKEVQPGAHINTTESLKQWITQKSWGHHACCTSKMGRSEDINAVLDGKFRVRGTRNLRVVDASIFPRIMGFFMALPTYLASEKAYIDILNDSKIASFCK